MYVYNGHVEDLRLSNFVSNILCLNYWILNYQDLCIYVWIYDKSE